MGNDTQYFVITFKGKECERNLSIYLSMCVCVCVCIYVCMYTYTCMCGQSLSCVRLFANPRTLAHQAPLSMKFSRQESWSGVPLPTPGDLPAPAIKPESLCLLNWQADSLPLVPLGKPIYTYPYITHTHTHTH